MILHTIVDLNEVLTKPDAESVVYEYKYQNNCILQCLKQKDGSYLDRIISTNPKDYLNGYRLGEKL